MNVGREPPASLWGFVVAFRHFKQVSRAYLRDVTTAFEILPRPVRVFSEPLELVWIKVINIPDYVN